MSSCLSSPMEKTPIRSSMRNQLGLFTIYFLTIFSLAGCGKLEEKITDLNPPVAGDPSGKPVGSPTFAPGFRISSGATVSAKGTTVVARARLGKVEKSSEAAGNTVKLRTGAARHASDN